MRVDSTLSNSPEKSRKMRTEISTGWRQAAEICKSKVSTTSIGDWVEYRGPIGRDGVVDSGNQPLSFDVKLGRSEKISRGRIYFRVGWRFVCLCFLFVLLWFFVKRWVRPLHVQKLMARKKRRGDLRYRRKTRFRKANFWSSWEFIRSWSFVKIHQN